MLIIIIIIIIMKFLFFILLSNCVNSELINSNRAISSILEGNVAILKSLNKQSEQKDLIDSLRRIDWTDPLILENLFKNQAFIKNLSTRNTPDKLSIFKTIKAFDLKIVIKKGEPAENKVLQEFGEFILTHLNDLNEFVAFSLNFYNFFYSDNVLSITDENKKFLFLITDNLHSFLINNKTTLKNLHLDQLAFVQKFITKINNSNGYSVDGFSYTTVNVVKDLSNLTDLSMIHTSFDRSFYSSNISKDFFKKLTKLKKLNLSQNDFFSKQEFPDLNYLNQLEVLIMRDTCLNKDTPIFNLPSLKILDLSGAINEFKANTTSPDDFFEKLPKLEVLILNRNKLKKLPTSLENIISSLKVLSIAHNNLLSLPSYITNKGKNLTELYFNNNCDDDVNCTFFTLEENSLTKLTNLKYCAIPQLEKISKEDYAKMYPKIIFKERGPILLSLFPELAPK